MESNIYTTIEERDKLNLLLYKFMILGWTSEKIGVEWYPSLGLYKIINKKRWMLTKIEYGI